MKTVPLTAQGRILIPTCHLALNIYTRFLGLMGRKNISESEGIAFPKCNSIHTFFMRFPIDVLLISKEGKVLRVEESVFPWRLLLPRRGTCHVIELKAHRSRELGITTGMQLECEGAWS